MRTVSAAEVNRQFSHILREVRDGESILVTSHGTPVAAIVPVDRKASTKQRFDGPATDERLTAPGS